MHRAIVSALLLILAVVSLAGARALTDSNRIPETPLESGRLGVASFALLVAGTLTLCRKPIPAALLVSLSGMSYVVANWGDRPSSFVVWCLLFLGVISLIRRAETERQTSATREAIHHRIDEEIVDESVRGNKLGHVDGR